MPTTLARTKAETTLSKILAAARPLFVARSYAEVTVDQIAAASGLTKGAVYHHFSSKETLYLALLRDDLDLKRRQFRAAVDLEGTCRERLRCLTKTFFGIPRESRVVIQLVRRDINIFKGPEREGLVQAYQDALPAQVETIIREGIQSGELKGGDPRLLSWHFVALVEVTLSSYAASLFANDDRKLDCVLDLFFDGAAADSEGDKE